MLDRIEIYTFYPILFIIILFLYTHDSFLSKQDQTKNKQLSLINHHSYIVLHERQVVCLMYCIFMVFALFCKKVKKTFECDSKEETSVLSPLIFPATKDSHIHLNFMTVILTASRNDLLELSFFTGGIPLLAHIHCFPDILWWPSG